MICFNRNCGYYRDGVCIASDIDYEVCISRYVEPEKKIPNIEEPVRMELTASEKIALELTRIWCHFQANIDNEDIFNTFNSFKKKLEEGKYVNGKRSSDEKYV